MGKIVFGLMAFGALLFAGCGFSSDHNVHHDPQKMDHNVHHDPQRMDIYIHRDRRRLRNPPPQENLK